LCQIYKLKKFPFRHFRYLVAFDYYKQLFLLFFEKKLLYKQATKILFNIPGTDYDPIKTGITYLINQEKNTEFGKEIILTDL
jgi:hypothetical protein